jgi:hypothetical protein
MKRGKWTYFLICCVIVFAAVLAKSVLTAAAVPNAPVNTSPPTIAGAAVVGHTLSASTGTWTTTGDTIRYSYQWQRCNPDGTNCVSLTGFTSSTYVVAPADLGKKLKIAVTGRNSYGSITIKSAPTAVVTDATPPSVAVLPPGSQPLSSIATFSAAASDNVGVSSVQFLIDGTATGSPVSSAPYTINVDTNSYSNGDHLLSAIASDSSGNQTTATPVTITINNTAPADTIAPIASVISPGDGSAFASGSIVNISASATDDVGVASVAIMVDGIQIANLNSSPYSANWTATVGNHTIAAQSTDNSGNLSAVASVSISVSDQTTVVAAVGDIACDPGDELGSGKSTSINNILNWNIDSNARLQSSCQQIGVANLIRQVNPSKFLMVGDAQYEDSSSLYKYTHSYALDPMPGPLGADRGFNEFLPITAASAGAGHDAYGGSGYQQYFGATAGPTPNQTWWSFDLGSWHIIDLNASCLQIPGYSSTNQCAAGSAQEKWLQSDLAAHPNQCTLAFHHHPMFNAGQYPNDPIARPTGNVGPLFNDLYAAGVDLVINGHDHDYQRYAPQDPNGNPDPNGIREIIVGTGGKNHLPNTYTIDTAKPNLEASNANTYGILKLNLHNGSYDWQFIPYLQPSRNFTDSGSGACH